MKVRHIHAENFLSIGEATITDVDEMGLVSIQGENRDNPAADSNGAGKSSLIEALSWCLYGKTAKGLAGNDVINDKAGKGCCVVVDLIDEATDSHYVIERYRKHKTSKNDLRVLLVHEDGTSSDLTKGTSAKTQEFLNQIIGCSHEVFASSVYAGQEAMPDLPTMTDKLLKAVVEEAAGTDMLDMAHQRARAAVSAAKSSCDALSASLDSNMKRLDSVDASLKEAKSADKEWRIANEQKIFDAADKRSASLAALKAATALMDDKAKPIRERIEKSQAIIDGTKSAGERLKKANAAVTSVDEEVRDVQRALDREKANARHLKATFEALRDQDPSVCAACGHELDDKEAHKRHLDAAAEKLREALLVVAKHSEQLAKIEGKRSKCVAQRDAESEAYASIAETVREESARIRALEDHLAKITNSVKAHERDVAQLDDEIAKLSDEVSPHVSTITRLTKEYGDVQELIIHEEAMLNKEAKLLDIAIEGEKVLGRGGVRAHILDQVTPYLTERTNHYLTTLTDGEFSAEWSTLSRTKAGELRERFAIGIQRRGEEKQFAQLSGGERRKVRLSCAMALQDLVATRAAKPLNIFVADEIDNALDEAGLERLMILLEEKAREKGTVMVVSHRSLSDWIRKTITVVKEGGVSRIAGGS